jgi:hypothetical protein
LAGASLADGARRSEPFQPSRFPDWNGLVLDNSTASPVEFFDLGLFVERTVAVAALHPAVWNDLVTERAARIDDAIRLTPTEGEARVTRRVRWPKSARPNGMVTLEADARAPSGAAELVIDLYADPGYDPDEAQIVAGGSNLGTDFRTFRKAFGASGPPEEFLLRAFSLEGGPVELREARLLVRFDEHVTGFPIATNQYPDRMRLDGDRITLAPQSHVSTGLHLPVRAFDVLLEAEAAAGLDGRVELGVRADTRFDTPRTWQVEPSGFDGVVRLHRIAVLPPDLESFALFARAEGAKPFAVTELSATDVCALRGYRDPRRLANGLFLYRNPGAAPRAYTVGETIRATTHADVRRALLDFSAADVGRKAVVAADVPADLGSGAVERASFAQRSGEIVVQADGAPTLLVVNERFDPDIAATIDGVAAPVLPVNGLVRGVVVPEGRHLVRFEYRVPRSVWAGFGLALLGALTALFASPALGRLRFPAASGDQKSV